MIAMDLIKGMTSNQLVAQFDACNELEETCWANATDGCGECERWFSEYNDAKQSRMALGNEIRMRKANGTLYNGMRGVIAKIYEWAKGKCGDEHKAYNMTRAVMRNKYDIDMVKFENTYVFFTAN